MATTFGSKKVCHYCGTPRDKDEMPKQGNKCKPCLRAENREKSLETSRVARRTAFKSLVAGIRGNKINVPHTSELAAEMIRLYGGLERFCSEWKTDLDALRSEKPGSKAVLDAKASILKLIVDSTNQRESAPDLAGLSDEDLEKEFAGLAAVLLQRNPDVLVELLEESGKKIVDTSNCITVNDGNGE